MPEEEEEEESIRFTRLKLCTAVFMASMLSLFFVATKQSLSLYLNTQGLALFRFRDRVVSDPLGGLSNWKAKDGLVDPCLWFGFHCSEGKIINLYKRQLVQISNPPSSPPDSQVLTPSEPPSSSPSASPPISFPPSPSLSPSSPPIFLPPSSSPASSPSPSPSPTPTPTPIIAPTPEISPANPPFVISNPPQSNGVPAPSSPTSLSNQGSSEPRHRSMIIWSIVGGFSLLVLVSAIAFACFCNTKLVTVKPWPISLSGQLQKAFVTGVPSLKRAELEAACEDFSNIIGSLREGTIYKGTLFSGVEIAVVSTAATSPQNWSKRMEAQFKTKLETLSKVNHKNFVNLLGFCEDKQPFTRMMVFEYAPNGTLYEHLHIREGEQLDWGMRVRIAMGIAYCLEYMHQLTPPIAHTNLQSSSICLTEDYAAKISDLSFWNDIVTSIKKGSSAAAWLLETPLAYTKGNVYSFGLILFELITGKIPYTEDNGILTDWAVEYLRWGKKPFIDDVVDPALITLKEEEIEKWFQVIRECVHSDPEKRPTMREVTAALKEITAMEPNEATPKSSPLWWAELEIMSEEVEN